MTTEPTDAGPQRRDRPYPARTRRTATPPAPEVIRADVTSHPWTQAPAAAAGPSAVAAAR